jgi:hypothetical protein
MIKYLEVFFEEKEIPSQLFELKDSLGTTHFIDTEAVIEIIKSTSVKEQRTIADMLRKIDFVNGDVNHYLKHLAQCFVNNLAKETANETN